MSTIGEKVQWTPAADASTAATRIAAGTVPLGIAADATTIHWGDFTGTGSINTIAKGDLAEDVLVADAGDPAAIAVDATHVYWIDHDPVGGSIRRVAKSGGPTEVVAAVARGRDLAIDDAALYWVEGADDVPGALWRLER